MNVLFEAIAGDLIRFTVRPDEGRRAAHARMRGTEYEISGEATVRNGRVIIETLTISLEAGLTARALRDVPVAEILSELERKRRDDPESFHSEPDVRRLLVREREPTSEILRSLRQREPVRGASDGFYRDVARAYLALLSERTSQPVKALTREMRRSKRHAQLSNNSVASWIRTARSPSHGWLTPAEHGKAGADPGPRLIEWWQAQHDNDGSDHGETK